MSQVMDVKRMYMVAGGYMEDTPEVAWEKGFCARESGESLEPNLYEESDQDRHAAFERGWRFADGQEG